MSRQGGGSPPRPVGAAPVRAAAVRSAVALLGAVAAVTGPLTGPLALGAAPAAAASPVAARPCPVYEAPVPGVPPVANPFDPAQADVEATFTGPGGAAVTVPAFAAVDQDRALVAGHEQLTAVGGLTWRVRFSPPVAGSWTWQAAIHAGGADATTAPVRFSCAADAAGHGVPVVSGADPHQLAFADGSPFVPLGENLAWYGAGGTFDYDRWLDQLAAHGATWIRVWMPSWAMGIEWSDTGLGDYSARMDRAWQLDHVLQAAAQRGIVVQLVLLNHGAFSTTFNSEWAQNPYNAANGGPLATPGQFFTDATARALFERRLRYIAARWAAYPNLVWELWNEVDLTGADPSAVVAWHAEVAPALRALDPYHHLITTSTTVGTFFGASSAVWDQLWPQPDLDLVQVHVYGTGDAGAVNLTKLAAKSMARQEAFGKPVALAEVGVDSRGCTETSTADPTGKGVHEGAWTGLFAGGTGGGMSWWWDCVVEPDGLYGTMLDGLRSLVAGVDVPAERFATGGATGSAPGIGPLQVFALRGATTALVWVRNPNDWWYQPDPTAIAGSTVTVTGLPAGTWRVTLVDPFTGATAAGPSVMSDGTTATVTLEGAFVAEQALRLERQPDVPATTTTTVVPTTTTTSPTPTTTTTTTTTSVAAAPAAVVATPAFTG